MYDKNADFRTRNAFVSNVLRKRRADALDTNWVRSPVAAGPGNPVGFHSAPVAPGLSSRFGAAAGSNRGARALCVGSFP